MNFLKLRKTVDYGAPVWVNMDYVVGLYQTGGPQIDTSGAMKYVVTNTPVCTRLEMLSGAVCDVVESPDTIFAALSIVVSKPTKD